MKNRTDPQPPRYQAWPLPTAVALLLTGCGGDEGGTTGQPDAGLPAEEAPRLVVYHDPMALTSLALDALDRAPTWLQDDLSISLAKLEVSLQDEMANLVLSVEGHLVDEVAFVIAHTSPEVLGHGDFYAELITLNAWLIYRHDDALDYVELVDVGVPDVDADFHTTARYKVETSAGVIEEETIDRELYYWYVVHPRLEDELPFFVHGWTSAQPVSPEIGWFWREFLWSRAAEECPLTRDCPLLSKVLDGVEVIRRASDSDYETDAQKTVYDFVHASLRWGADPERPVQPVRIYCIACGHCGEYADLTVASLRTALIPARNVGARSNDHTWAEWWSQQWWGELSNYSGGVGRDRRDNDCNGIADDALDEEDLDEDGWSVADGDCDDTREEAYPGAPEVQNGLDDNCSGSADDGLVDADLDGDGDGWSITAGDCADFNDAVYPGAPELANGSDDDCDGVADNGAGLADGDGDGFTIAAGDCDDTNETVYPGATEEDNAVDDDCDGVADDGTDLGDADGDGYTVAAGDCDDGRDWRNPGATEIANGIDDDCNTVADDGADLADHDADGFSIAAGDCDEGSDARFPGATETGDARDDDCDGLADEGLAGSDRDGDGYTMAEGDCNDLSAGFRPGVQDPSLSSNRLYLISSARGDSFVSVERTEAYGTLKSYLDFTVTDANLDPVDGALVMLVGTNEVYGHPEQLLWAGEIVTDLHGHAVAPVGEYNPYYYSITSAVGEYPGGDFVVPGVTRSQPLQTYEFRHSLAGEKLAPLDGTEADAPVAAETEATLTYSVDVQGYRVEANGSMFGSFSLEHDGGHLDVFVVDTENLALLEEGEPFAALVVAREVDSESQSVDVPLDDEWTVVLSNQTPLASTMVGTLIVTADPLGGTLWAGDPVTLEVPFRIPPGETFGVSLVP